MHHIGVPTPRRARPHMRWGVRSRARRRAGACGGGLRERRTRRRPRRSRRRLGRQTGLARRAAHSRGGASARRAGRAADAAQGGSAVDAAIAVQMMLTLVEPPQSSGIGGGLFLMHFDGQRVQAFDGRVRPRRPRPGLICSCAAGGPWPSAMRWSAAVRSARRRAARSEAAHRQHSRLPWARLFEPAIAAAERGVPVSARLALQLRDEARLGSARR